MSNVVKTKMSKEAQEALDRALAGEDGVNIDSDTAAEIALFLREKEKSEGLTTREIVLLRSAEDVRDKDANDHMHLIDRGEFPAHY